MARTGLNFTGPGVTVTDDPTGDQVTVDIAGRSFDVTHPPYNAVPDAYFTDGVVNGTTAFTSATANFVSGDATKHITILNAGSSGQQPLTTTINSVTNSTTVVLTNASGQTQTGRKFYLGRGGDQTAAIQSAIDACSAAGGGRCSFPRAATPSRRLFSRAA
jgi:hypothetical protein